MYVPTFFLLVSAERYFKPEYKDDFRAMINFDGRVSWTFGGHFKTTCPLNIKYYPFDEQTCAIIIENWKYPKEMVNLKIKKCASPMYLSKHEKMNSR